MFLQTQRQTLTTSDNVKGETAHDANKSFAHLMSTITSSTCSFRRFSPRCIQIAIALRIMGCHTMNTISTHTWINSNLNKINTVKSDKSNHLVIIKKALDFHLFVYLSFAQEGGWKGEGEERTMSDILKTYTIPFSF